MNGQHLDADNLLLESYKIADEFGLTGPTMIRNLVKDVEQRGIKAVRKGFKAYGWNRDERKFIIEETLEQVNSGLDGDEYLTYEQYLGNLFDEIRMERNGSNPERKG